MPLRRSTATRLLLAVAVVGAGAVAAPSAQAAAVTEVRYVKTVGDALIRVEIRREAGHDAKRQGVLLTYSPYHTLASPGSAAINDGYSARYNPRGIARAWADVLGTRGSDGCWDYGGKKEIQSGVDVVEFLAGNKPDVNGKMLDWSNGNVGMIGASYDGTTATMVASTGTPGLKAVVPIAAISHWYGYAYHSGVRYLGNSTVVTDEGFDTPLLFDFGFGRTVVADPQSPDFQRTAVARTGECEAIRHTQEGYSRSPDYGPFWQERDYTLDMSRWTASTLLVHGWQDYNVKQDEAIRFYDDIPVDDPATPAVEGARFRKLWMTQGSHSTGQSAMLGWQGLLDEFLAATLLGDDVAGKRVAAAKEVVTLGRTAAGALPTSAARREDSWPPAGTSELVLNMDRSFTDVPGVPKLQPVTTTGEIGTLQLAPATSTAWTWTSAVAVSEEETLRDPSNRQIASPNGQDVRGHGYVSLFQESGPLLKDVRVAGSALLDAWVNPSNTGQHLTPLLVEVLPNGELKLVQRGFLNLDYARGLAKADPRTGWQRAQVQFLPQDYTFTKGNRIGLLLQSTNTVWAVPGNPGLVNIAMGKTTGAGGVSQLRLPVVAAGAPTDVLAQ